ncbi:FAD-dependent oxidoreductase [Nonomuraea sp. WAC 01424]|uniref:FAD-dependent oxidoreductase n=1 Tax=Nonomuraea sp. WAC 01424 TaxID=2203200 RepID=UPI000F7B9A1D|nr:FAD-dependent oxidoreductase [Nonomuraea sp. WAC 01424]RSN15667.1 FAD-dependent oxidoreductase [Nonomuraea sp. WAC 01424]
MYERSAIVVGGGIAGLAVAVGLRRIGWRVTVLERDPVFGAIGAGISLLANGLRALDSLGMGAAVRDVGRRQSGGKISAPSGRLLTPMDDAAIEDRLGTAVYSFLRPELHNVLAQALPSDALVPGALIRALEQDGTGARVHFTTSDGDAVLDADIVIGADGLNSWVRSQMWPEHSGTAYSGATVWRGVTSESVESPRGIDQTWGRGMEFGFSSLSGGRIEWHALANASRGTRYADELGEVRARFGSWHDPIPAVLAATPPEAVLRHDIFDLVAPLPSYVRGRTVLIGDAAHAMQPHLGQGAGMALEDAVVLAAELRAGPDPASALARYDHARRPRTQAVARNARRVGRMGAQLENRLVIMARNTAMRLLPASVGLRELVRTADWTPVSLEGPMHKG